MLNYFTITMNLPLLPRCDRRNHDNPVKSKNRVMNMSQPKDICLRTFSFSVQIIRFCRTLEKEGQLNRMLAKQLFRASTSIGANVEEAQAGQTKADFIAKMSIARKEAREAHYWLRLCKNTMIGDAASIGPLLAEINEIVAILTAIVKNAQQGKQMPPVQNL
ncbi:MAG: four helix bundle protein [bacterium]|nr:four helix bundle protein [bacterium]